MNDKSIFESPKAFHEHLQQVQANETENPMVVNTTPLPTPQVEESVELPTTEPIASEVSDAQSDINGHMIPKSRFDQINNRNKALEEQLQHEREARIRYEEQINMLGKLNEVQQEKIEPETFEPLDQDTFKFASQVKKELEDFKRDTVEHLRQQQLQSLITVQEQDFASKHPDYMEALNHVKNVEYNIAKGLGVDDIQAQRMVDEKLRGTIMLSVNGGKNPSETIYNMAKTYGFNSINGNNNPNLPTNPNLNAIRDNMARTANAANLGNNAAVAMAEPNSVNDILDEHGRVNPEKFHARLQKLIGKQQ